MSWSTGEPFRVSLAPGEEQTLYIDTNLKINLLVFYNMLRYITWDAPRCFYLTDK